MQPPGKAFYPGFCIPALAARGAPNVIGPLSKFQRQPPRDNCDPTRAATAHAAGMNVGMADGTVRTLSASLIDTTWWALVTPSGNDFPVSDW